jgi:hypothetical protein
MVITLSILSPERLSRKSFRFLVIPMNLPLKILVTMPDTIRFLVPTPQGKLIFFSLLWRCYEVDFYVIHGLTAIAG